MDSETAAAATAPDESGPSRGRAARSSIIGASIAPTDRGAMLRRASVAALKMEQSKQETKRGGLFSFAGVAKRRNEATDNPSRSVNRRSGLVASRPAKSRMSMRDVTSRDTKEVVQDIQDTVNAAIGIMDDGLSSPLASALFVNLISIGYLSLPWAFAHAGTILSTIGFALVMLQTFITAQYVLEACARSHALAEASEKMVTQELHSSTAQAVLELAQRYDLDNLDDSSHHTKAGGQIPEARDTFVEDDETPEPYKIGQRFKSEMPELCRLFLGRRISLFFLTTISLDLYGLTWSYAAIFASGLADRFPIKSDFRLDYAIYIVIFAGIVVPLSCMQLSDHIFIQLVFLAGRLVMFLLMISTVAAAWVSDVPHFDEYTGPGTGNVPLFYFPSLYLLVQISIFSTAYQFAVPGISDAVKIKDSMLKIVVFACGYVFATVLICSSVLSTFFGPETIETSSNLNWGSYHGGTGSLVEDEDGEFTRTGVAAWAKFVGGYIVVFPALDSLAVFPLCTISLGEILLDAWNGEAASSTEVGWKKRTAFRLLGCCPQIVGAAFVSDLGVIANYAGLATVLSYTVCPTLLSIYSKKALDNVGLSAVTHYQTPFSRDWVAWMIFVVAIAVVMWVIVSSAMEPSS